MSPSSESLAPTELPVLKGPTGSTPRPSTRGNPRAFSYEIHGVRGLALTMVVAFHLFGQGRVSGGVDVFLVISSYLITGSLLRAIQAGKLSLVHRYGRTFSRLLPAALLTIVVTTVAALVVLPRSRWLGTLEEAQAAALFRENNYLATTGLSYEAAGSGTSPFQHFCPSQCRASSCYFGPCWLSF